MFARTRQHADFWFPGKLLRKQTLKKLNSKKLKFHKDENIVLVGMVCGKVGGPKNVKWPAKEFQ